jgi:CubicO group peptidase (beta-lactamase class C family)
MTRIRIVWLWALASLFASSLSAQTTTQTTGQTLASIMDKMAQQQQFSGAVLVFQKGQPVLNEVYGKADFRTGQAMKHQTLFNLGPASQEITAIAVLKLVDQGKLTLDAELVSIVPELPYAGITIRHLLSHTSGLPDYETLFAIYGNTYKNPTNEDLVKFLAQRNAAPQFRAGKHYQYVATNYALLATVVERKAQQSFAEFVKNQVFIPLGMTNSLVWFPEDFETLPNRAYGFRTNFLKPAVIDEPVVARRISGDKNILVSLDDLKKWHSALASGKLISPALFAEAIKPYVLTDGGNSTSGLGFGTHTEGSATILEQDASYGAYRIYFERNLNSGNAIYILNNTRFASLYPLRDALANVLEGKAYVLPKVSIAGYLASVILNKDVNTAVGIYESLKKTQQDLYIFRESELNKLGFELLDLNRVNDAIEIFKLNVAEYPASFNVYDSLGEAYARKGDKELAISNYKRSLDLYPENENARIMVRKLSE